MEGGCIITDLSSKCALQCYTIGKYVFYSCIKFIFLLRSFKVYLVRRDKDNRKIWITNKTRVKK